MQLSLGRSLCLLGWDIQLWSHEKGKEEKRKTLPSAQTTDHVEAMTSRPYPRYTAPTVRSGTPPRPLTPTTQQSNDASCSQHSWVAPSPFLSRSQNSCDHPFKERGVSHRKAWFVTALLGHSIRERYPILITSVKLAILSLLSLFVTYVELSLLVWSMMELSPQEDGALCLPLWLSFLRAPYNSWSASAMACHLSTVHCWAHSLLAGVSFHHLP